MRMGIFETAWSSELVAYGIRTHKRAFTSCEQESIDTILL
jgi:hypothetical protein